MSNANNAPNTDINSQAERGRKSSPRGSDLFEVRRTFANKAAAQVILAHGWGLDGRAMINFERAFSPSLEVVTLDFPGFGKAPRPPDDWSVANYADAAAEVVASVYSGIPQIWIGHSFGCRVGIRLAAQHPQALAALCLVSAAGLPRQRSAVQRAKSHARSLGYKSLNKLALTESLRSKLFNRFASEDYKNAGEMRGIFRKVIADNLSDAAAQVTIPCQLICGEQDIDTPPEISERLSKLIARSALIIIPQADHHNILTDYSHQVHHKVKQFITSVIENQPK